MDSLTKLQLRKAELKAKMERERAELKNTFLEIREEIEPANLLKKAVSGMIKPSKGKAGDQQAGGARQLPSSLSFLADVFIRDPRIALLIKLAAPFLMKLLPNKKSQPAAAETPEKVAEPTRKAKLYSNLRRNITALRNSLKKTPNAEPVTNTPAETAEN